MSVMGKTGGICRGSKAVCRAAPSPLTRGRRARRPGMLIYKIFRAEECAGFEAAGTTRGAPVDLADGYIHFSTAEQVAETAAKHFAEEDDLVLLALESDSLGDALRWEPSRGGRFSRISIASCGAPMCFGSRRCRWTGRPPLPGPRSVTPLERAGLALLHRLDPETAHGLSLKALNMGLAGGSGPVTTPRLATTLAGLPLANPVGLAAGYDKNAEALAPLMRAGFGFLEVGAATPRPQDGQPPPAPLPADRGPRRDQSLRLQQSGRRSHRPPPRRAARRYPRGPEPWREQGQPRPRGGLCRGSALCGPHVDFATVNVSSPNTEALRDLQGKAALSGAAGGRDGSARHPAPPGPGVPQDRAGPEPVRDRRHRRGGAGRARRCDRRDEHDAPPRRAEKRRTPANAAGCRARRFSSCRPASSPGCRSRPAAPCR